MANDNQSLSHSVCTEVSSARNLQAEKMDIGKTLQQLCKMKKVEIIEAEACPDYIHLLESVPPYLHVAQFADCLKGKSSLMIFDRHANLKYKYGNRHF